MLMQKNVTMAIALSAALFILSGCMQSSSRSYELTRDDVFSVPHIKSTDISVNGIGLGDTKESLERQFGKADRELKFDGTTLVNYEYGKAFGSNDTALMFQLDNGVIKKITIKKPFNKYLHGKTVINYTKEELYFNILGVPDREETTPWFRVFYYDEQGIQVFVEKSANGFALAYPSAPPPGRKHLSAEEIAVMSQQEPSTQPKNVTNVTVQGATTGGTSSNGMEHTQTDQNDSKTP